MKRDKPDDEKCELQFVVSSLGAVSMASIFYLGSKTAPNHFESFSILLFTFAIPLLTVTMVTTKAASVDRSSLSLPFWVIFIGVLTSLIGIGFLLCGISVLAGVPFLVSMLIACWQWFVFEKKLEKEKAEGTGSDVPVIETDGDLVSG